MTKETDGTILYGMMGSGKSTLGAGLARHYDQPFTDTDELIEARVGMSCAAIINDPFRNFASEQAATILGYAPQSSEVIATGGSVAVYPHLTRHLSRYGVGIFLNVDPVALEARLPASRIAALNNPDGLSFPDLYAVRAERYRQAADFVLTIETSETVEQSLPRLIDLREQANDRRRRA